VARLYTYSNEELSNHELDCDGTFELLFGLLVDRRLLTALAEIKTG
jgi:hypothetical protein